MIKPTRKKQVYLDHAATTPVDDLVLSEMLPYFSQEFGNPSSLYSLGRNSLQDIGKARLRIANVLNTQSNNIIFTGSGTESNNLAIFGIAKNFENIGKHIISSTIEHPAVLKSLEELKKIGFDITFINVDKEGIIDPKDVIRAIRPDTILVSLMYANNEIGSIQPIEIIGKEILKYRKKNNSIYPFFHSDACQAVGVLDLNLEKNHLDLLSFSGSKIYAPKGIGALYVRQKIKLKPLIFGGGQEKNIRSGTENVAAICGLAKAVELIEKNRIKEVKRQRKLNEYFLNNLKNNISDIQLNGPDISEKRLANNLNISFKGIEGEAMLLYLDEYGIMCSTGSACSSESLEVSHVLKAIKSSYENAHASLRFTIGKNTKKTDIDYVIKYLAIIVKKLREISPSYNFLKYEKK